VNPLLTDDAVAALPIHDGRAELLEEIVRSPVLDERPAPRRTGPTIGIRRAWVAPVAAAVAIVLLVLGVGWTAGHVLGESAPSQVATQPPHADAFRVVLADPGWTVTGVQQGDDLGGIGYRNGSATLKLDWYPAAGFDDRLAHRRDEAGSDGTPVEIAGLPGWMWSAAGNDHTALRPAEDGHFLEVRGSGMDAAAFAAVLPRLDMVDATGFDAALPPDYAHDGTRGSRVDRLLDGIAQHAQPLLPDGVDRSWVTSDQSDPVQLGTEVADRVACAWIARYADARSAGDEAGAQQAAEVLSTSRQWPVLRQIEADSDEPEWIWWAADEVAAGRVPQGWRPSCAGHLP
jgi:hypothetical protein